MDAHVDVLIFGGGGAGLWLLDELHRRGFGTLLAESDALGAGQTVASQGIIHGGVKYTLTGLLSQSARTIRDMPAIWRDCLAGRREPHLTQTRVAAEHCYLWRTETLKSKVGLMGARKGLRSTTARVPAADRPAVLASCPGDVFRVDEQVIDPVAFIGDLAARHTDRLVKIDPSLGAEFATTGPGQVSEVILNQPQGGGRIVLRPRCVVFAAGAGNAGLCAGVGLPRDVMQRRPLHMVMVRGRLPELFGHCIDGAHTRATITSTIDSQGRTVWQVGGQVAEDGVDMPEGELIRHARRELESVLPNVHFAGTQWAAYPVDRAEGKTPGGTRPVGPQTLSCGNVLTIWPTKLALVPQLAKLAIDHLGSPPAQPSVPEDAADWPRPTVAVPPWEASRSWHLLD